ncbi:MAG: UDP-N-acetylmuramoyl-tripeptide--D-alanyl-D-alanine ligase [Acidobacteriota bacterium]
MSGGVAVTATMVASAAGGRLVAGDSGRVFDGFSIDSRTLRPGDLFFAVVAARDGHAFVPDALARGAAGLVVSRPVSVGGAPAAVIEVVDTTAALQALARTVRRASGAVVVAITGSAGKTTTKEAIAELLSAKYRVVRNRGNLNNHLGLPLSLLELRHGADVAVMELGMNHAGEIRVLVGIAEPEIRVWTNVGDAHIGHFDSADGIADAKAEILERALPDHLLVCNADDARVMARARAFAGRTRTFGFGPAADVRAVDVEDRGVDGMRATVRTPAGDARLEVPLIGRGNLANVLCATAVALELGVPLADLAARIGRLQPAPRRGQVRRLPRGVTLIDDSYNSSPSALASALDVLARDPRAARRVAVLGEMLELGDHSVRLHEAAGRLAAGAGLARLITVGGHPARALGEAAKAAGLPPSAVAHAATSDEAARLAADWVQPGDLVLVKGSRGIRTDVVVDRLAGEGA